MFDEFVNLKEAIFSTYYSDDEVISKIEWNTNFIDNKDNFNEEDWKSLYRLSENTFVEETDSLKKGAAGAGLTDND